MIIKYVTTVDRMSAEDLSTYATELVAKFNRGGLDRVEVVALPATPSTTVREVARAITDLKIVNALPPYEQVEFTASFQQIFKKLPPNAPISPTTQGPQGPETSVIFMLITTEK